MELPDYVHKVMPQIYFAKLVYNQVHYGNCRGHIYSCKLSESTSIAGHTTV